MNSKIDLRRKAETIIEQEMEKEEIKEEEEVENKEEVEVEVVEVEVEKVEEVMVEKEEEVEVEMVEKEEVDNLLNTIIDAKGILIEVMDKEDKNLNRVKNEGHSLISCQYQ